MADPAALYTLAQTVKTKVVDYFAAQGWSLPTVRQVVPGLPAYDCEMLAVQVPTWGPHQGDPTSDAPSANVLGYMRYASLSVYLIRCVPTVTDSGDPPSVDDTEAAALTILSDGTRLHAALIDMVTGGFLPGCHAVAVSGWRNLEPGGALGGGVMSLVVDLTGW